MNNNFKYDIAFSFLKKDQELVTELYNLLKDKVDCFVYFNEQERLAGRNGENVFNNVFAKEARMVVIAYDKDWGETNWTRVEETAIRNRGHEEGYDFVTLMPIQSGISAPVWLPKNRIWLGLKTYGTEKAAVVLESRVQELFGAIKEITTEDKIIKEAKLISLRQANELIINSMQGIELAKKEFEEFKVIIENKIKTLQEKLTDWHWKIIDNNHGGKNIMSYNHTLFYMWTQSYRNTGEQTGFNISIWNGYFNAKIERTDVFWDYKKIDAETYYIGLDDFGNAIWKSKNNNMIFSSEEIADSVLLGFFEHAKKHKT